MKKNAEEECRGVASECMVKHKFTEDVAALTDLRVDGRAFAAAKASLNRGIPCVTVSG